MCISDKTTTIPNSVKSNNGEAMVTADGSESGNNLLDEAESFKSKLTKECTSNLIISFSTIREVQTTTLLFE
ncbi:uncharacterized protein DFL_008405 [Arthrobotrys flagrans]|uniref:Uncharacterized protein n=1 Tax=Arthrobotrys flagrans TaxID=97331 RepID=A0A436ZNN2_ARTFL|nr:hypothetical protein DFL_008405 [Arthrobotrys flagrans]